MNPANDTLAAGVSNDAAFRTDSRKVYILPTRFGILFGGALMLMLLVSVNYNNGLGHLFTFLLAGVAVVAMHYTQRNLVGIRFKVEPGRAVFAGETAVARVTLNDELHRDRWAVWVRGGREQVAIDLEHGGHTRIDLPFATTRRGLVALPSIYLVSIYPIGLFCAWTRTLTPPTAQMVYPRPAPPTPLPDSGYAESRLAAPGGRRGDGDFQALRDHQMGDPLSRIHWRASERGVGIKTKLFEGEGQAELLLRFVQTPGTDTEARISILCRWVLDAEAAGLRYALELPGHGIEVGSGARHEQRCLELLAQWRPPE